MKSSRDCKKKLDSDIKQFGLYAGLALIGGYLWYKRIEDDVQELDNSYSRELLEHKGQAIEED